jgi:formylglycine-generating enzyme required for sulfatase activity
MLRIGAMMLLVASLAMSQSLPPQLPPGMIAVKIGNRSLNVARFEVSIAEWRACHDAGGCGLKPQATGNSDRPMTGVNWFDAMEYVAWARETRRQELRLPTRDEWLHLARFIKRKERPPLFLDERLAWAANYGNEDAPRGPPHPRGTYGVSPDGVSDLSGNVWEWTSTCTVITDSNRCPAYVVEGAHEAVISVFVRDPATGGCALGAAPTHLGLRLVSD